MESKDKQKYQAGIDGMSSLIFMVLTLAGFIITFKKTIIKEMSVT
jgi:hypothetical protein